MCVRKEAGLEPETSDSIEQRRQKALPSPVQVLSARKFLGVIDISGAFVPLSQFLLFRSALPTWLPCPLLALTGTSETQLRPGLQHNSGPTAVPPRANCSPGAPAPTQPWEGKEQS